MAELKINANDIDRLVQNIKNANKSMNTSVSSIDNPSKSSGIMISSYVDRIKKISKLLENYKRLLEKDAADIVSSKNKLTEMDQRISSIYKNSGKSTHESGDKNFGESKRGGGGYK